MMGRSGGDLGEDDLEKRLDCGELSVLLLFVSTLLISQGSKNKKGLTKIPQQLSCD